MGVASSVGDIDPEIAFGRLPRGTQSGGEIELGIRLPGEAAVAEFFVGYERRFDAHQLDLQAQSWFMVGFRVLRQ
jgi:hypothetical protein